MIREYLQNNLLVTDGAMGTYYSQITEEDSHIVELANLNQPEVIARIHTEYIDAGAKLIRTNTFSANPFSLKLPRSEIRRLLLSAYEIAEGAAKGREVYVAADIGPIPEMMYDKSEDHQQDITAEYKFIADTFLEAGAGIFVFETFSSLAYLEEIAQYIKAKNKEAFVIVQFALTPDGFTRKGISCERIVKEVKNWSDVDVYGFNCGVGPTHIYNALTKLDIANDLVAVLPNAGYPEIINERTIYRQNSDYFAGIMKDISSLGVKILGGCCGTTPVHISKMVTALRNQSTEQTVHKQTPRKEVARSRRRHSSFFEKMKNGHFVVAVELDPPFDAGIDKLMESAWICKENGVDVVTIADSPMGKARGDSVMIAAKIKREVGIEAMPHICCRDKNLNALKSSLLAGHIEEIRNILAVTGDPVAPADKAEIKGVFNLSSIKLMELITEMNRDVFAAEQYCVGGALNLNTVNKPAEVARMFKKAEKGASFFLTQPIFAQDVIDFLPTIRKNGCVKILGGIMPLVSYKNAQFLNNEIPGIQVPAKYINRFDQNMTRETAENVGIDLAVSIAKEIRQHIDGYYFITPFNKIDMITKIIKQCLH